MNLKNTARVLDDIARDHVPENTNLLPQITARIDKERKLAMKTKTRLLIVALIVLSAVAVTLVSFPGVVTAMQRLFGYIPGVGIVEQNAPIRVLAAPVTVTRQGVSITVTSATLTADQTHIEYRIFGVPRNAYPDNEAITGCIEREALVLPDGARLVPAQNFPPVPGSVNQAVLVIPCIANTLPGKAPENWQIPISFVPAPPDLTVMPVIELSPSPQVQATDTLSALPAGTGAVAQATLTGVPPASGQNNNSVTVEKVIESNDGYILVGQFNPQVNAGDWVQITGMIQLQDTNGKKVAYTEPQDISTNPNVNANAGGFGWVLQFKAAGLAFPLTITFPGSVLTQIDPTATAEFTFDAGPDPQPGQAWTPNQEIQLAGHILKLVSVSVDSRSGYGFRFQSDGKVSTASLQIEGYSTSGGGGGGGGGGGPDASSTFDVSLAFTELPRGKLKVIVSNLTVAGDPLTWQGQWSPANPRTDWPAQPASQPGLCLSVDQIGQLQPAPAELTHGAALFYEKLSKPGEATDQWGVVLYPLDGNPGQVLATDASWGSLSADGSRAAYPAQDGIHVVDLAARVETVLAGAGGYDLHLSPDGRQIAFVSSNADSISVMDTSGASPARRISEQGYESVIGWSPDSRQVYIAIPFTGGSAWKVQVVDVATQAAQDLFTIENGSYKALGAALSPDGSWIAYRGRQNDSLVLVRTDGTQMHAAIENSGGISGIAWSKSGWIGLSLFNPDNEERRLVLLQPESCQAYVLPGLHGDLEGLFLP
jgi:hypothetical protein